MHLWGPKTSSRAQWQPYKSLFIGQTISSRFARGYSWISYSLPESSQTVQERTDACTHHAGGTGTLRNQPEAKAGLYSVSQSTSPSTSTFYRTSGNTRLLNYHGEVAKTKWFKKKLSSLMWNVKHEPVWEFLKPETVSGIEGIMSFDYFFCIKRQSLQSVFCLTFFFHKINMFLHLNRKLSSITLSS